MLKDLLRYRVDARKVGAVLMVLFAIFLAAAYMVNRTFTLTFWDKGYELQADFTDADGIANASDVRIAGVYVGQVTSVRPIPGGKARLTFRVDGQHRPLHTGTRVELRLQTLLGTKFLDLKPGPSSAPEIQSGDLIASDRTKSPVDFDQVLQSFDDPTRHAIQGIIKEAGTAVDGRGAEINTLLSDLNALSVNSGPDLQTFNDRGQNLDSILRGLDDVGGNLSAQRQHLANVNTQLNAVLGTIAANDSGFRRFIDEGDASLGHGLNQYSGEHGNISATVSELRSTLDQLNPLLSDVDQAANTFAPILQVQRTLSPEGSLAIDGYNHNPAAGGNCPPSPPGCGGFYLRQFAVLANPPVNEEIAKPNSAASVPAPGARGGSAAPGGSIIPSVPGLPIPGLSPSTTPTNPLLPGDFSTPVGPIHPLAAYASSQDDAEQALLLFLLGV